MTTREEVIQKVTNLVNKKYGGNWKRAFDAKDKNSDNYINIDELSDILEEAGIGFKLTRAFIAKQIIDEVDSNNDFYISFAEFEEKLKEQQ